MKLSPLTLLLHIPFIFAQPITAQWQLDTRNPQHITKLPTGSAYYSGSLTVNPLPVEPIELWWENQSASDNKLILRSKQNEVPVYWLKPEQAGRLIIKNRARNTQTLTITAQLTEHAINTPPPVCENAQAQSKLLKALQTRLEANPSATNKVLQTFWQDIRSKQTPIIEPINQHTQRIIYLWRGAKHNVRLLGGPSNDHDWLQRLPNSDVWYKEYVVNTDYQGSYVFAVDVPNLGEQMKDGCLWQQQKESRAQRLAILSVLQLDPHNPHTLIPVNQAHTQRNENLFIPTIKRQQTTQKHSPSFNGSLTHKIFTSERLKNQRHVSFYQPNVSPSIQKALPTLVFLDGEAYTETVNVPHLFDQLISEYKIPPVQAVFIHNPSSAARQQELPPNPLFNDMMRHELMPWLSQQLNRPVNRDETIVIGSSYGGLAAANLGLQMPEYFSHVVALSGSFWWHPPEAQLPEQANYLAWSIKKHSPHTKTKWFLSANSHETGRDGKHDGILETTKQLRDALSGQHQDVVMREYSGGHNYQVWQTALQDALLHHLTK